MGYAEIGDQRVLFVGEGNATDLMREASGDLCDVLMLFEVQDSSLGTSRTFSYRLFDLERREEIASSAQLVRRAITGLAPLEDDAGYREAIWQLRDALHDELTLQSWPEQIRPDHAKARVEQLAQLEIHSPLVRLAEMTLYRNRGLIDDVQLLAGYRALLGEAEGIAIMLGSDQKKRRILRQWLPTTIPDVNQGRYAAGDKD